MAAPSTVPRMKETLKIADGTTMEITRLPDIDDATWAEARNIHIDEAAKGNPETAKSLQNFAKNPEAMRGWLQTQAIAEHYNTWESENKKLTSGDAPVQDRVKSLEQDPELKEMFEDIKKNGMEAAMKYYQDETLMLKISQKMGGLPEDLQPVLRKIEAQNILHFRAAVTRAPDRVGHPADLLTQRCIMRDIAHPMVSEMPESSDAAGHAEDQVLGHSPEMPSVYQARTWKDVEQAFGRDDPATLAEHANGQRGFQLAKWIRNTETEGSWLWLSFSESSWQSRQMRLSEDSVLAVHGEPAMESEPQALVQRSAAKLKLGFGRRTRNKQLPKRQDSRDGTGRALAKRDHLAGGQDLRSMAERVAMFFELELVRVRSREADGKHFFSIFREIKLELMGQDGKETPLTLHEARGDSRLAQHRPVSRMQAAKNGDLKAVQEFLQKKKPLDSQDHKGITALGYAIGSNRIAVVKLLLDSRANPFAVDSNGNSGLHYAAGYGRKELLEYLLKVGINVNQRNAQGQTPLAVAQLNKQEAGAGVCPQMRASSALGTNSSLQRVHEHVTFCKKLSLSAEESRCQAHSDPKSQPVHTELMDRLCGLAKRPAWRKAAPSLLVREDPASKPSAKVAGFDLNDTLVSSKIGAPGYQVTVSDWIFYSAAVPRRIAELHEQGFRLVVFTNQGNIRSALDGKRAEAFKGYVDDFAKKLEVPLLVIASTQRDKYRKPNTGMWEHLAKVNGVAIDLAESFYIGDAAGGAGEHSADDAEFAKAVGVRFTHTRDYFGPAGGGPSEAGTAEGPPKKVARLIGLGDSLVKSPEKPICIPGSRPDPPVLLILVGLPGCGKSTFADRLGPPAGSEDRVGMPWRRVCQDLLRSKEACVRAASTCLSQGISVIIDRTNINAEQRAPWVSLAAAQGAVCHALVFDVPLEECCRRAQAREQHEGGLRGGSVRLVVSKLNKTLQPVSADEAQGFARIRVVKADADLEEERHYYGCSQDARRIRRVFAPEEWEILQISRVFVVLWQANLGARLSLLSLTEEAGKHHQTPPIIKQRQHDVAQSWPMLMLTRSAVTRRSSLPAVQCSPVFGRCIFQGQKQMVMPGLMLKDSSLHGTGVFTTREFAAKEVLEVCACLWVAKPSVAAFQPQATGDVELLDYLFAADKGERGRLLLPLGFGLAYNHGVEGECNASYHVKLDVAQPRLIFRALRDIVFDEEVLIDYGEDWWQDRGWRPLSARSAVVLRRKMVEAEREAGKGPETAATTPPDELQRKLKLLTSMGFPADASAAALEAAAGDTNAAANSLLAEPPLHTGAWWRGSAGLGSLRLQVSSFFVELGPAAPRSPASCPAAMSLKASRGGVLVGGGPGGLERRVVVDLQPPKSLRGEHVGEVDSNEGWEKLPESDDFRVALELESEALEQWGVWLFAGQRFARITGPAAATCCSSLATLRKLCPKALGEAEDLGLKATVGEASGSRSRPREWNSKFRVVLGAAGKMQIERSFDVDVFSSVVPYFDRDDATVGGSIHLEDGAIVHKLPSGSMQRWKMQLREEALSIGSTVQYWSTTVQRWVSASVLALNEDGTYRLDIKKRASRQFIKEAAAAEASQEMPAAAEPAVPSGNARVRGHASLKHEKVAARTPAKRQRRARSSSIDPNKAKAKTRKKTSTSSEKQSSSDSDADRGSEESSSSETS
ncbi:PNKP [Symbiodinium microadriaticum]|nr:PNKP [Symbiodinium microadriaticum]